MLDTLKKAAAVLRDAGLPFALAGGGAAYARGAGLPLHDVDFVIREADADAAAEAFAESGMRVERPPEGWLIKAFDGDRMVDVIFRLAGHPDMRALLDRADEIVVAGVPMPVLSATDLVISFLGALSEHHADFARTLNDVYIAGQVERALSQDQRTHELGVRVEVSENTVVLRGEVAGAQRRRRVAEVAAEAAPGLTIRNEVLVTQVLPGEAGT